MTSTYAHERRKAGASVSVQAIKWAIRQRAGSTAAKAVLLVLAEHADSGGLGWPSQRTIAEEAECDQRSVRRHVDALTERGLVTVTPGAGRGSSRYQLAIARRPDASLSVSEPSRSEAHSASLPGESETRSEASGNRSEALDHRSEATRASDQQQREQNHYVEPKNLEPAAPPPPAQPRGRRGGRAREAATPAELNATAHRPDAYRLVGAWLQRNPGVTGPQRRQLSKAVSTLLDQGADAALLPAALDEAHNNPRWHIPHKALPMAYEAVRRRAAQAAQPGGGDPASRIDSRISDFLSRSITDPSGPPPDQRAIGGAR